MEQRIPIKADPDAVERRRWLPQALIGLDAESTEETFVFVEALAPTWRDVPAILLGRYRPLVVRRSRMTLAAISRTIKGTWTSEAVHEQLYDRNPLLDLFRGPDAS